MFPVSVRSLLSATLLVLVNLMFSGLSVVANAKSLQGREWQKIVDKSYGKGIGWTKFAQVSKKLVGSSLEEIEKSFGKPLTEFKALPGEVPPLGEHVFYKIVQEPVKDDDDEVRIYLLALTFSSKKICSYTVFSCKSVNFRSRPGS